MDHPERSHYEGLISALNVAATFIIIGVILAVTPDILQKITAFSSNLALKTCHFSNAGTINLLVPADPAAQTGFFTAIMYLLFGIGILQAVILPIRIWIHSPTRRIASTVGSLVFWLGGGAAAYIFLLAGTLDGWFHFWEIWLLMLGISLVARALVYFARWHSPSKDEF